jgi:hypothetical protein
MSDLQSDDLTDPAVRAELGLEERTEGGVPEPTPQPSQGALKHVREALELQTKAKAQAEQEAAQLRRELAVERSNLPEFPGKGFFLQNYNGEPTPDAIRSAAEQAGFVLETPAAEIPAQELEAHRAVAAVSAGSTTGGDVPLEQALLTATSPEEVLRIVNQAPTESGLRATSNILS